MSNSYHFMIMSLQSLEEIYHKVCHNYLSYFAISPIVSGKGSRTKTPYSLCNVIFLYFYIGTQL